MIDAFCGAGGNSIQFAFTCECVIAIDIDPVKIEIARNNAKVYGVADRIEFICADFFDVCARLKADVIFFSPPWGGPAYLDAAVFDLAAMQPSGAALHAAASAIAPNVVYFLPKNTNLHQMATLGGGATAGTVEIEQLHLNYKYKGLCAYYGDFVYS